MSQPVSTGRKTSRNTYIAIGVVAVMLVACLVAIFMIPKWKNTPEPTPSPTPSASATPTKSTGYPLLDQYPNAPKADNRKVTVSILKGNAVTTTKKTLTISGSSLTSNSSPCSVQKSTDFCFVGKTTVNGMNVIVYYMKETVRSRMFENPTKFQKVSIKGSPSAGVLSLETGNQNSAAMVVTLKDSSGWLILSDTSDLNKLAAISPKVILS